MRIDTEFCNGCIHGTVCKFLHEVRSMTKGSSSIFSFEPLLAIKECPYVAKDTENFSENFVEQETDIPIDERIRMIKEFSHQDEDEPCEIIGPSEEKCAECGKDNVELLVCSECGKHICSECATEDFSGKIYCSSCYDEKPPIVL